ncbi:hypothetical protein MCOR25_010012 [Pyricularia grisea]|uniref:amidase n=1 Tax=Pyricularia grisea TaxID=148305 RepID=A0A6P8BFZ7_PYRGI|nr:uncharacterized protein PgNI_00576 [Pyricularia grisea]KAI6351324.1 hypothetical protein MCOR25_010012 [Pyricularia grisea]TLD15544.1 hypothetical protein PgNI_00576 [Pyricularia grisea]
MGEFNDKESWKAKAQAKRASILAAIPREWRLTPEQLAQVSPPHRRDVVQYARREFLTAEERKITEMDAVAVVNAIRSRSMTAEKVTLAFCKTAAIAHQICNCLLGVFFDLALERAKQLDKYQDENNGRTVGPLHGLPVSLKDQFHVKGVETTMGYVGWIGGNLGYPDAHGTHEVQSQTVDELEALGAVMYCKTSVPQTLLFAETENNIVGRTANPHNMILSPGGSSGGEGALIALGGSTIGVGTDIGGSVRIPAGFCGIYSLKPTPERLSYRTVANAAPGQTTYRSAVGYMGTSIDGLNLMLQSVLSTNPWVKDPAVLPLPYRQDVMRDYLGRSPSQGKPLKLGILWRDGIIEPHPPVTRAITMVYDALKKAGHSTVDWCPPSHKNGYYMHLKFLYSDGREDIYRHLRMSGESLIPLLEQSADLKNPLSLLAYQDLVLKALNYEEQYADYWRSTADVDGQEVDAIIAPVCQSAAVIPGKLYSSGYTEIFNLLNYSVAVIPVTKANKEIDIRHDRYKPKPGLDDLNWNSYDPEIYHGAPVGIQIVGKKFEEEKVLAIAHLVHQALQALQASEQSKPNPRL